MTKFGILVLTFLATACSDDKRETTTEIAHLWGSFEAKVDAGETTVTCRAYFAQENAAGSAAVMDAADTVSCGLEGSLSAMSSSDTASYWLSGVTAVPGATYAIALTRSGTAYTATMTLPDAPVITAPSSGSTISKSTNVTVTWTAGSASNQASVGIASEGAGVGTTAYDQNGTATLSTADMQGLNAGAAHVVFTRLSTGTVPSGFASGLVYGTYASWIPVTLNP